MKKWVALLCFGVVFGVFGKNYEAPKAADSKKAAKDKAVKENVILDLEEAIVSAYNNNAAWKARRAEKDMAYEQYKRAEAIFLPTLDASLTASRTGNESAGYNRETGYSLKEETEKLNKEAKDMISSANKTAETIVKEAKEEGEEIKQELIEEGKQQTKQMMENAQRDIEQQKDKMYEEMHDEMVKATISAAEKLLETKLDGKKEKDNIDSFIKEVINS